MDRNAYFNHPKHQRVMEYNGLTCVFHMPSAVKSRFGAGDEELEQGLPPGAPRVTFNVDEFPGCPEDWMRGGKHPDLGVDTVSYFVPIEPDHGMWLDFNQCAHRHSHYVAVGISVQGVNPVTGLPTADQLGLAQYLDNCPKHNVPSDPNGTVLNVDLNGQNRTICQATQLPKDCSGSIGFVQKMAPYVNTCLPKKKVAASPHGSSAINAYSQSVLHFF